ncbi:rho-related GTP-binding protein Rho6 isoform X2 [Loxodonta africana]|uniref:rho-related GTP-binding protein Rho6 isoform X2 n=1 Tax=Loxodonta africana TaxID=9785 RepID=UPI000C811A9D|nr:rho-related GTP-binding protein Rho6 isoform X2 [Loxodonta africana]XP_049738975.1 rho-related GTP-binding protein Rho6 isoform X2 [Elephas maximus indicus]
MKERRAPQPVVARCKLVLVGDVQCGKTAMLQVLAKDCYPETYVPTVFENYTACLETEEQRVELSLWDTSGSPYYDNVRPLCYSDSDAVLLCFDISRPETVDSALKKGCAIAKQLGAEIYLEGSAFTSEKSVHSIFRTASMVCLNKASPVPPKSPVRSLSKRLLHLPSRSELISSTFKKEKAKSCSIM